ncbi:hypothetical protein CANARDRAFT_27321 [[Candida] arabinofermentans NRRL YB-2248]|uniref:Uncharacterized protein n=1 Tax=[Candida] arabinofermentans NRRL YB-2248 TaxID=983967 RepID=A0A1E4T5F2_9ASCO|nr:hypothetical protein CANARDRAFT_27321 [[Candida] arabinofermentans NRRL YB-2248]
MNQMNHYQKGGDSLKVEIAMCISKMAVATLHKQYTRLLAFVRRSLVLKDKKDRLRSDRYSSCHACIFDYGEGQA